LVCKNPKSVDLLEVPDGIKDKYLKQANDIDVNLIMRGLNALSKADISYKSAKNQRLLVEVCLMELCSLKQEQEKKKP
jgi:DNA polymerase-3 subunit gamma/tau